MPARRHCGAIILITAILAAGAARAQDKAEEPDNGTNPTKTNKSFTASYEYRDLARGAQAEKLKFAYTQPFGAHTSVSLTVPVQSNNTGGDSDGDLGDIELRLAQVFGLTRTHGYVARLDVTGDTAGRPDLGSGQTIIEPTFIYARFLKGGAIFAPSFDQSWGVDPQPGRARVNNLTVDFYYVPKLKNPKWYMTVDPAVAFDWDRGQQSGSLGIQVGHSAGTAFGGHGQLYVKPTTYIGAHRPADWGVELGYKLIGF